MDNMAVYVLVDPTGDIRYVGVSADPKRRYKEHMRDRGQTHKVRWIRSLLSKHERPLMRVIQEVPFQYWAEAEKYWISFFKSQGCPLTNGTDGGEGTIGARYKRPPRSISWTENHRLANLNKNGKAVVDQFGRRYASAHEAARVLGVLPTHVTRILRRRRRSVKGFTFAYAEVV